MDDSRIESIEQLEQLVNSSQQLVLTLTDIDDRYAVIDRTVDRFGYKHLKRKQKHVVYRYLRKLTGYKKAQLLRLIKRATAGKLLRKEYHRTNPNRIYTSSDVKLLEQTDEVHLRLNAAATHEILRREREVFHEKKYERIAGVSISHINNLRHHPVYVNSWVNPTAPRETPIGSTQPPPMLDIPGAIRVDTVSQRDVYHINAVDELTQWEVVVCVPAIAERFMLPALTQLLASFPFPVVNFHSDRGGEFINHLVSEMLNRLVIKQTKSRSRHCNDNALVESKNGSVIRKTMGYGHIHQTMVDEINQFYREWFVPYLNFHRPSLYLTGTKKDDHGRERRIYGEVMVPYEKLKQIANVTKKPVLKSSTSWRKLDTIAYRESDNVFAQKVRNEKPISKC